MALELPQNIDQFSYDLLGLNPTTQLKRTQLLAARLKAEAEIDDLYINEREKEKRKEHVYDAYRHLVLIMKAKKSKEQQEFIELEAQEAKKRPEYKLPVLKKAPLELLITNNFEAEGFVLLKGTLDDIRVKFDQWLTRNHLDNQQFSLVLTPVSSVHNAFSLLIRGPAEGPHVGKLGMFLQELIKEGYISARENVKAKPFVSTSTALPTLMPAPRNKKKTDEEEEKNKLGVAKPKSFGTPKANPYKN